MAQTTKFACGFCGKKMRSKAQRTKHAKDCQK